MIGRAEKKELPKLKLSQEEIEEVKNLDKWEQMKKKNALSIHLVLDIDFYLFNLTNKIQGTVMRESKGPSINLKNINFINRVEDYERKRIKKPSPTKPINEINQLKKNNLVTNDYINKHSYMIHGNLMRSFEKAEIPHEDQRTIEDAFNKELIELKCELKELRRTRKNLFADNNKIYFEIEKINDEVQVV